MRVRVFAVVVGLVLLAAGLPAGPARTQITDLTPTWMTIPVIGVNAPIESVGMDAEGLTMALPSGGGSIAWFNLSSLPGDVGNAIMAGHVDYGRDTAVFWNLNKLVPGDYVNVFTKDGSQYIYQVSSSTWYNDKDAPVADIFAWTEEPTITLITCGGTFDSASQNYDKRLVVVARASWDWKAKYEQPAAQPSATPEATPTTSGG